MCNRCSARNIFNYLGHPSKITEENDMGTWMPLSTPQKGEGAQSTREVHHPIEPANLQASRRNNFTLIFTLFRMDQSTNWEYQDSFKFECLF